MVLNLRTENTDKAMMSRSHTDSGLCLSIFFHDGNGLRDGPTARGTHQSWGWTSRVDTPPGCLLTNGKTTYCVPGNQLDIFIGSLSCSRRERGVSPELGVKMRFLGNRVSSDNSLWESRWCPQPGNHGRWPPSLHAKALLFRGWNSGGM